MSRLGVVGRGLSLGLLSVAAGVGLWQLLSMRWPATLLPGPADVVRTLGVFLSGPVLVDTVLATLYHVAVAAGLVIAAGSAAGLEIGRAHV